MKSQVPIMLKFYHKNGESANMLHFRQKAMEIIQGGYDLHIHSTPSHFERIQDDLQVIRDAAQLGMAGILLKNHYEPTSGRAALVNRISECEAKAYGGIVLNWPAGGINSYAVESALAMGAVMVWLPTRDAQNCLGFGNMDGDFFSRAGITVLNEQGRLLPKVYEVIEVIRRYDAVLATGHISTKEAVEVCKAGREMGIKMVFTHPEWPRTKASAEIQKNMADIGVVVEKNWMNIADNLCKADEMLQNIRAVGPEHVFIATDRGQKNRETPVEGMLLFIQTLLEHGFTEKEIKIMLCQVPAWLVAGK